MPTTIAPNRNHFVRRYIEITLSCLDRFDFYNIIYELQKHSGNLHGRADLHSRLSMIIYGNSYPGINKLIDSPLDHDASRYNIEKLFETYKYIYQRYSEVWLCNLAFHHYPLIYIRKVAQMLLTYYSETKKLYTSEVKDRLSIIC